MANWIHIVGVATARFYDLVRSSESKQNFHTMVEEHATNLKKDLKNNLGIKFDVKTVHNYEKIESDTITRFRCNSEVQATFYTDIESADNLDKKFSNYFDELFHRSGMIWDRGVVQIIDDHNGQDIVTYCSSKVEDYF